MQFPSGIWTLDLSAEIVENDFGHFSVLFFEGRISYIQKLNENEQYAMLSRENESRFHYLCLSDSILYLNLKYQCLRPLSNYSWMIRDKLDISYKNGMQGQDSPNSTITVFSTSTVFHQ